jgi:hypothetical protein
MAGKERFRPANERSGILLKIFKFLPGVLPRDIQKDLVTASEPRLARANFARPSANHRDLSLGRGFSQRRMALESFVIVGCK